MAAELPRQPERRADATPRRTPGQGAGGPSPALALPKGGGAIRGLGEKLSHNPATGSASLSVPIAATPSRGLSPELELQYDGGSGNGPCGLGWSLSVPSIARRTDPRIPRYDDDDVFVLGGAEDLVPVDRELVDGQEVTRYRPRVEGLYARIERLRDPASGDVHWRTSSKEGLVRTFGRSAAARVADPADPRRVFRWLLEEVADDRGNLLAYEHKAEDRAGVDTAAPHEQGRPPPANRYLKRVRYGNRTPGVAADWAFEVVLDYGEHDPTRPRPEEDSAWPARADPFSSCRAGFEIRTSRLLRRVLAFHRFPELGPEPCLARSTDLSYRETPVASFLVAIEQAGYVREAGGDYRREALPPIELEYTERVVSPQLRELRAAQPQDPVLRRPGSRDEWLDLDGEGLPGLLLEEAGAWRFRRNEGEGRFGAPRALAAMPSHARLAGGRQQLTDAGGDGTLDLVELGPGGLAGFSERRNGDWDTFRPFTAAPNLDWNDPHLRLLDLTGDGRGDALVLGEGRLEWHESLGHAGFAPAAVASAPADERDGPALVFADAEQSVYVADMSGDGLGDIVRIRAGEVAYWPNLGYGRFGARVVMSTAPRLAGGGRIDHRRLRLADVDGSGTTDLVELGPDGITLWPNESGNAFGPPERLPAAVPADALDRVVVLDALGRGTACLVWEAPTPPDAPAPMRCLDLMAAGKPHLLRRMVNNLGRETEIEQAPATAQLIADRAEGVEWASRPPFPVHVVARTVVRDHVLGSRSVTTYRYRHGYFDRVEREFAGWGYVEQEDAEAFTDLADELVLAPVVTRTWRHTGRAGAEDVLAAPGSRAWGEDPDAPRMAATTLPAGLGATDERECLRALRGQVLREEVFARDGDAAQEHPYQVTQRALEVRLLAPAADGRHAVCAAHQRERLLLRYERDPGDPRAEHELALAVDAFGTVTRSATVAYPRRAPAVSEQERALIIATELDVVHRPDGPAYRLGVQVETRSYELTGLPATSYSVEALADALDAPEIPYEAAATHAAPQRRLIERVRFYYDDDAGGAPLPLGEIGLRALPAHSEHQAFTPGLLAAVYGEQVDAATLAAAGYRLADGVWWSRSGRALRDPARFFVEAGHEDALGARWATEWDVHTQAPVGLRDPLGNAVRARLHYRTLLPWWLEDANGNRSAVRFDALGGVAAAAVMGKPGAGEGDRLDESTPEASAADDPTSRSISDRRAWLEGRGPVSVRVLTRARHGDPETFWQETVRFCDGGGEVAMAKVRAEPGLAGDIGPDGALRLVDTTPASRWIGSGRVVLNNKGLPVRRFEPYYATTDAYDTNPALVEQGAPVTLRYDALGRPSGTDTPDGRRTRVERAAWEERTWDESDAVLGSRWLAERQGANVDPAERRAATLATAHADTPARTTLDALGRTARTAQDAGAGGLHVTRVALDIEGNRRAVIDARERRVLAQDTDMVGRALRTDSADAGARTLLPDVLGRAVLVWDAAGRHARTQYDALGRATHAWVRDAPEAAERLVERTLYGETAPDAAARNLRGRPAATFDGAGCLVNEAFDFKGNALRVTRRLARRYDLAPDWSALAAASDPDTAASAAAPQLEATAYTSATTYDALDRPVVAEAPRASGDPATEVRPSYDATGLLTRLEARVRGGPPREHVRSVAYDAHGRREEIVYGNDVRTRYEHDTLSHRLRRLVTERPGGLLQDLRLTHDPVGNPVEIRDLAQPTVFFDNQQVEPVAQYEYDSLYRLVSARGREHPGQAGIAGPHDPPSVRLPHPNQPDALRAWTQRYAYDEVGNLLEVAHAAGPSGGWTRRYDYEPASNRLRATSRLGESGFSDQYAHDAQGNMTAMPGGVALTWDHEDLLASVDLGGGGRVHYRHDAAGRRVRKVWEKAPGLVEEQLYLGGCELTRRWGAGEPGALEGRALRMERHTLQVMDDVRRIALVETLTRDDSASPQPLGERTRLQLANHQGTPVLEVDETARVISYEEQHPFGSTALLATSADVEVSRKRFRYTGAERDEETGLQRHGPRCYAPWLGRWTSPDPAGVEAGVNLYAYGHGNPVRFVDPSGGEPRDPEQMVVALGRGGKGRNWIGTANENMRAIGQPRTALNIQWFESAPGVEALYKAEGRKSGALYPMFSGHMVQEALEGNIASAAHIDMRGVDLTPKIARSTPSFGQRLRAVFNPRSLIDRRVALLEVPGESLSDFHTSSEARQLIAHLQASDVGGRKVDVHFLHEGGTSSIPRNVDVVQGAKLSPKLEAQLGHRFKPPTPAPTGPPASPPAPPPAAPPPPAPTPSGGGGLTGRAAAAVSAAPVGPLARVRAGAGALARSFVPGFAEVQDWVAIGGPTVLAAQLGQAKTAAAAGLRQAGSSAVSLGARAAPVVAGVAAAVAGALISLPIVVLPDRVPPEA